MEAIITQLESDTVPNISKLGERNYYQEGKAYRERIEFNRSWLWDNNILSGDRLSISQKRKMKEIAKFKSHIPHITVNIVEVLKYSFAGTEVVEETIYLPKDY